jgi:uncharacterized protein
MVMANTERLTRSIELLRDGLRPKCEETWKGFYGEGWLAKVNSLMHTSGSASSTDDVSFLLKGMKATWNDTFSHGFSASVRALVFELAEVRNNWAHQKQLSTDDTVRALDSMERVLEAFGNRDERMEIKSLRRDLMRQLFDEEGRAERRKTAARPTEGQPAAGLTPWRDIITPHTDVASGLFEQAEFAADLFEVASGTADVEYQDPVAFFARTYLTEGLTDLLVGAARRLSGGGSDPVIELQTNFGGGKTHSMIGLFHLASGVAAGELPGVGEALASAGVSLPPKVNRAVIVGQMLRPSTPQVVDKSTSLRTLWGQLAFQLGGLAGYEIVRRDDEMGTNPGSALKTLFQQFGPAVILIDEWVAYARQLREAGDGERLPAGDFDTQFTFAQALTEAAAAVPNVVVLISIPASDIEVGGDRGRAALEKLKNVTQRKAKQWQPASPDESFEIVRRRLFDPITPENARVRDGVIRAYDEMYRTNRGDFPPGVGDAEYRRRMELSYPIHPELFDRLFGEWSTLDKFQRTRGVLRLMAIAISQLWQRGDQSLLITPATLPMDSASFVSEIKKYLEEGWDPVIKSDVDGENALPLRIDQENKHFGRISATRRVARSVYMASAPRPDGSRGVDIKSVVLGCTQPGESPAQFADALKRLSGQATHLYVDGSQYWYSLKPNVTRMAADRAASNFSDHDADDEVKRRLGRETDRGAFAAIQVFAEGPGDVPDDDEGVRLVVLSPEVSHAGNDANSPAVALADRILSQRESGPRLNRNLLVFVAAAPARLTELRASVRAYLAWRSIVEDKDALDLTPHQQRQATSKRDDTSQQVDSLMAETFTMILTPTQKPGTAEIEWQTSKATATGQLAARVEKKLISEEKIVTSYGGIRVRMDIDRYNLWSDRGDIKVRDLWSNYARFPHMPRLGSVRVLSGAVSDGTSNLSWSTETFGYAEAHTGDTWLGVRTGEHVAAEGSGLILRPDVVPVASPPPVVSSPGSMSATSAGSSAIGAHLTDASSDAVTSPEFTRFYARFELDSVRGVKQFGEILEHVTRRLGSRVKLTLEVEADNANGFDETTRRIVGENASNLGATAAEFE